MALSLAARLPLEIVSCDSRKVYRGLNLGSAKPTASQRGQARFHLLDIAEPAEQFSVQGFLLQAHKAITDIRERGKIPLLEGGTGLYIEALLGGFDFGKAPPLEKLRQLFSQAWKRDSQQLSLRVRSVPGAEGVDLLNPRRVIRLLERVLISAEETDSARLLETLGLAGALEEVLEVRRTLTASNRSAFPPLEAMGYRLEVKKAALDARIHARTATMLEAGLVDEVRALLESGVPPEAQSLSGIGYSEAVGFLQGGLSFQELAELITIHTRQYAKRQETWNRRRFGSFTPLAFTTPAEQAEAAGLIESDIRREYGLPD